LVGGCNSYQKLPEVVCLKNSSHEIKSIDLSESNSDLSFLKKTLNDDSVNVVMLGEQTHYDGTTFIAKSKLVKFLHEECGFDVLAFESGFYDCNKGWELIKQDKDYDWIKAAIFGHWGYSKEFSSFIKYLQGTLNTPNPVILSGFDDALTGSVSTKYLLQDFDKLKLLDPDSTEHKQFEKLLVSLEPEYQNNADNKPDSLSLNSYILLIDNILARLDSEKVQNASSGEILNKDFWRHVLSGLKIAYRSIFNMKNSVNSDQGNPTSNRRDSQMADNLMWLLTNKYPGKKIIVWAANFHIMRNYSNIDFPEPMSYITKNTVTMGDLLYKSLGRKIYSISFTDYENYFNGKASYKSIEFFLDKTGYNYSLINFRETNLGECLNSKFFCRVNGHIELNGEWDNVTDGIFFIREIDKSAFEN
jgi:erythromycin esterase